MTGTIVDNGRVIPGQDFKHYVDSARASLEWFRVVPGDVVAIVTDFSVWSLAWFFATTDLGCVAVPLTNGDKNQDGKETISETNHVITIRGNDKFHHIRTPEKKKNPLYNCLDGAGLVLFSSGSSGKPKAILHDYKKILKKWTHKRPSQITMCYLKWDHIGGINTALHTLLNDGCLVISNDRSPEAICRAIDTHAVEILPTTPSFLNLILMGDYLNRHSLKSLTTITYGTEPMPEVTLHMIRDKMPWVKLKQTYGLSEVGILRSKSLASDSLFMQIGGEGVETRIRDGKLEIKSDNSMIGYLNDIAPYTEDGWFMTGDLVEQNGEFIKIKGRESDVINCGGEKVFPQEIEHHIRSFQNIKECLVYGEQNPILGKMVCAKVSLIDEKIKENEFKASLNSYLNGVLDKFKVPMKISIVKEIGLTDRGKLDRSIF